jgi:hypothetical protein
MITCILFIVFAVESSAAGKSCDSYPDFSLMSTKTDYELIANVTNYAQYSVESKIKKKNCIYIFFVFCLNNLSIPFETVKLLVFGICRDTVFDIQAKRL